MPTVLPRRTPWSCPAELELVYSRLFLSDANNNLQRDGLDRIKVWIARGNCPHAVESTANLLDLILVDRPSTSTARAPSPAELRLSYSMAIIRFVNSLVDPLQTTYYARSIASLAAQIGLPLWFVELRHQATHEELPSLSVLRDAARQALDWLYTFYWHPLLNASSASSPLPPLPLDTLRPHIDTYKSILKTSIKDASLAPRLKNDLLKTYKEIERKRPTPRVPVLPEDLVKLWHPLLSRLDSIYASFPASFSDLVVSHAVDLLCAAPTSPTDDGEEADNPALSDNSYALTLTAWVVQLVVEESDTAEEEREQQDGKGWDESLEAVVKSCLLAGTPNSLALLDALLRARSSRPSIPDPDPLAVKVKPLVQILRNADGGFFPAIGAADADARVEECETRRREVEAKLDAATVTQSPTTALSLITSLPNGASSSSWPSPVQNWTPRPIGYLPGGRVEALDLPSLDVVA
ncbi:hypothetical protein JCM11641_002310 [Rhodosporidiobolus odoratus]